MSEMGGEGAEEREVIVLEDDLFFSVRIEKTLAHLGLRAIVCTTAAEALTHLEGKAPAMVIANFGSTQQAPGEVVKRAKALPNPPPVLGYVSHVWLDEVRPNAMAAGCDLLVANSALTRRLPQLVAQLLEAS